MKKFLSIFLAALFSVNAVSGFALSAEETQMPADAEILEFDREYWAETGKVLWYAFEAPAPSCHFTAVSCTV